jgi:acyl-CoA synthetase (AMP-forming)/AMP-acid ligase II
MGYVTFLNNNYVSLLLNSDIDLVVFENLINIYHPQYLWLPDKRIQEFKDYENICSYNDYTLIKTNFPLVSMHPDLSILLTTSGSTGSPKLVRLTKKNLRSNAESIVKYLGITKNDRPITSLPMYYSFGLSIINTHLISGSTILLTKSSYIQKEFWNFAKENKCTSFSGVPFTYEILKKINFWKMEILSLKILTQAGGKLNNNLIEYFATTAKQQDIRFYVMYGQTEATARMSYLSHEDTLRKLGSIGIAIPCGIFELRDDSGNTINQSNVVGELVYKGENVCLGYAENINDLQKGDENSGILFTGDLAYRDEDGYYFISGRKKRFLKIYGNRVNLDSLESLLKQEIGEVACVGTDDKLIIYIIEKRKKENVISYIVNKIKINKNIFDVRIIDEIPRSDSGKILYSKLAIV